MVETTTSESQAGGDVVAFQIRELLEHLVGREPRRQQVQHVRDPDAEATHARTPTALVACAAPALAANLVLNGSFENGLTGWTIGGTDGQLIYPPAAITYSAAQPYPDGAFGEAVPANDAATNSPDAAGERAAYFVSDLATNQSLSQIVGPLAAGLYQIGFSAYAPANGHANFYDAHFSGGVVATVNLANYDVSDGPATTWKTFASNGLYLVGGTYTVEFLFNTAGYPAKDVVIDQVYMIPGDPSVPEPATLLLLGCGLAGALVRRRK